MPPSARSDTPAVASANCDDRRGTNRTRPKTIIRTAPACATISGVRPTRCPAAITPKPSVTKATPIPAASANGP
jgi:hypothetical protein